jgi:hypothetical protein
MGRAERGCYSISICKGEPDRAGKAYRTHLGAVRFTEVGYRKLLDE